MNTSSLLKTLLSVSLLLGSAVCQAAERVGDFSLLDQIGNSHTMSWYDDHGSIALMVQANGSQASLRAIPEFVELLRQYSENILFVMINPRGLMNRDEVHPEISTLTTDIPVLMDASQLVSKALGNRIRSEVILSDPKSFRVVIRGSVGAQLKQTLTARLHDEEIATAAIAMQENDASFPARTDAIFYVKKIARVNTLETKSLTPSLLTRYGAST